MKQILCGALNFAEVSKWRLMGCAVLKVMSTVGFNSQHFTDCLRCLYTSTQQEPYTADVLSLTLGADCHIAVWSV